MSPGRRRAPAAPTRGAAPRPAHPVRIAAIAAVALGVLAVAVWLLRREARPRPNLLLVTIDTLRADRVGAYGHAAAETPALDALAARGARFESAQSPVPITGPAHATIFTGRYPPAHGVRDNVVFTLGSEHQTLAALVKQRGYDTGAFVAAIPVAAAYGFGQGFDTFNEDLRETPEGAQGAERRADAVVDAALAWLAGRPRGHPWFAWVHLYDPHAPYAAPAPYGARFAASPYDGEVAFADAQLGRLLGWLADEGREADTVVAVMADHGESLGEHGETTHAVLVYEATLRVPLLLAGRGVPRGAVIRPRVSLVDALPTLLALLAAEAPAGLPGRDLTPLLAGRAIADAPLYAESLFGRLNCRWAPLRALTQGEHKLVVGAEGREELFDLARDPGERHDLSRSDPRRVQQMHAALRAAVRAMAPEGDRVRARPVSAEQEARLRALGYVGGVGGHGALDAPGLPDPRARVHVYERVQAAMAAQGAATGPALDELARLAAADEGNPFVQMALGHLAYRAGRLGLAARAFARAVELDPDRPAVRAPYGRLLRELGRLDESERHLRIAFEQSPEPDLGLALSLADTLIARGDLGAAERVVDEAVRRAPTDPAALLAKARVLVAQAREAEAETLLERGRAAPADEWVALGEAYLRRGQPARARESAEHVLRRAPAHPWALALAGHALVLEGKRDAGLVLLRRAVAQGPRRPAAWLGLAAGFAAAGDEESAARCRRAAQHAAAA